MNVSSSGSAASMPIAAAVSSAHPLTLVKNLGAVSAADVTSAETYLQVASARRRRLALRCAQNCAGLRGRTDFAFRAIISSVRSSCLPTPFRRYAASGCTS